MNRFVAPETIQERWDSAPKHPPDDTPKLEAYVRRDGMLEMTTVLDSGERIASDTVEEDTDGW